MLLLQSKTAVIGCTRITKKIEALDGIMSNLLVKNSTKRINNKISLNSTDLYKWQQRDSNPQPFRL